MLTQNPLLAGKKQNKMPFPYSRIESRTQEILGRWFKLDQDAKKVSTIIASLTNNWYTSANLEFVACASEFEALFKVNQEEKRFDEETFNREFSQMTASISNREFKSWIRNLVRNRKSARSQQKSFSESLILNLIGIQSEENKQYPPRS
nr:hypothetical protein [Olegusella massiliensis]